MKTKLIQDKHTQFSASANDRSEHQDAFSSVNSVLSGYTGDCELVRGSHPDAIERFMLLGVQGSPRLLLPTSPLLLKNATRAFLSDRNRSAVVSSFVRIAKAAGGPFSRYSAEYSLVSKSLNKSPIRKIISEILGRDDFQIALRFSFGRPNGKTVAMAISNDGEVLCYAKIGSEAMTSDLVSHESMILEKFWDSDLSVLIPRPLYSGTWAKGHQILITEALQLQPLPRDAGCAHIAAWDVASSGGTVNSVLRESAYWHNAVGRVSCGDDGENQNTEPLLKVLDEIKRLWGDREFDFGISHGDWTRSNVGIVDGRVAGLDWERCVDLAPCGIDIAHFTLSEETTRSFSRSVDLERVLPKLQHYLKTANSSAENAQPLITLALLEMVIRFRSARNAGLKSFDSKFEVALQAALQKWKV